MKTFLIKTVAMIFAIIGSHSLKSQNPYLIDNNLTCDVILSIQFYDGSLPGCPACGGPIVVTVPANTVGFPVPHPCPPTCNVDVTIIGTSGPCASSYTSGTGSLTNPHVQLPGLPACCGGPGAHFHVHPHGCHIMP